MRDFDFSTAQAALAYGVNDAARVLGIGRTTVYRLIAEGQIEARALGGRTVIPAESLHAFVASLPPAPIRSARRKVAPAPAAARHSLPA
jgi:excisionase family DNA binding protein